MASKFSGFLKELKRRKVYHVAAAYVAIGLPISLGVPDLFGAFDLPSSAARLVIVLVALGFPIALVLAWAYELRPAPRTDPPPTTALAPEAPSGGPGTSGSLAVLPFESMSPESEGDYFADGITEELTNALAKQAGLRVAARTSAFAFKDERLDVREIGKRLNVSHVIEGSVRRSGQTLRITAQLIDTADGYHLWSEQFDRNLGEVFQIQEEIAGNVARRLQGGVSYDAAPEVPSTRLSAYEAFLRGRHALATFGPKALARAIEAFETCIGIDDGYAPAYAGLADALTNQAIGFSDFPPGEAMGRARNAARRALELDPELPEGHLAMALVRMWHEFRFEEAKAGFDQALEINPNFADGYLWTEFYWTYIRRDFDEALRANREAHRLSPLDSRVDARLGTLKMIFGHLEEAEAIFRNQIAEDSQAPLPHLGLGDTLMRKGNSDEAVFQVSEAVRLAGRPTPWLGMLGAFYGVQGNQAEAQAVITELDERKERGYVSGFWMAVALAGLGRLDEAFSHLEQGIEERDSNLLYLPAVPRALGMHADPRFGGTLDQLGLGHLVDLL